MKILWLCNVCLPQISNVIGFPQTNTGGWLFDMAERLRLIQGNDFYVCFGTGDGQKYNGEANGINYRSFTKTDIYVSSRKNEDEFTEILKGVDPDVIHIFGTEFAHTLSMVRAAESCNMLDRVVIGIQGLISVIAEHYYAYLPQKVINKITLRDFIRHDNIKQAKRKFEARGINETEALKKVKHIMGRTDLDAAYTSQVAPQARYHKCNESLRNSFYENEWKIDACERHSIFVSQANYTIKGFHLMLEAFSIIKQKYPDAKLYTTGKNIMQLSLKERMLEGSYSAYLRSLITKYGLKNDVFFLGALSEHEMCNRFLKSNIFVCCSSIENSPNSVGEAMLLGVPTISSDIGGVKNMLTHGIEGYIYPADEPRMIAYYADKIFSDDILAERLSRQSRLHACVTHKRESNFKELINIYESIVHM